MKQSAGYGSAVHVYIFYLSERVEIFGVVIDAVPVGDRIQIEKPPGGVVVGQTVVATPLDVDGHQVAAGKVQRSEDVAVEVRSDDMVLALGDL